jgi:hypothetical protein
MQMSTVAKPAASAQSQRKSPGHESKSISSSQLETSPNLTESEKLSE